jgi:allantoin racemase
VICSVEAGIRAAIAALGQKPTAPHPHEPVATTGLSPALARRLG